MKLTFYTPSYKNAEGFGGATFGFAGQENETLSVCKSFSKDVEGIVLSGTYKDILANIPTDNFQAAIVLMGNAGGENEFIHALSQKVHAPLIGGSGAICPVTGESALIYGHGEAAVFLISDNRFDISVTTENIHYDILSRHHITFAGRFVEKIDGQDALTWYAEKRKEFGLSENDFEHLTLADTHGINAHLSIRDGKLFAGRDLTETMVLRYLPKDMAQVRIQAFYDDEDAIVFGCAGLRQTLSAGLSANSLGLFMFGEVCTVADHSDFGNLMLTKLIIKTK